DDAVDPLARPQLEALPEQSARLGFPPAEGPAVANELVDGERIAIGEGEVEVMFTPGHSPGHCALAVGAGIVLVGDVLFRGSIGRTDLPGGSFAQLERSIRERLFTLPDDVRCLPGHGPET